jgi:hypothetical protein
VEGTNGQHIDNNSIEQFHTITLMHDTHLGEAVIFLHGESMHWRCDHPPTMPISRGNRKCETTSGYPHWQLYISRTSGGASRPTSPPT